MDGNSQVGFLCVININDDSDCSLIEFLINHIRFILILMMIDNQSLNEVYEKGKIKCTNYIEGGFFIEFD